MVTRVLSGLGIAGLFLASVLRRCWARTANGWECLGGCVGSLSRGLASTSFRSVVASGDAASGHPRGGTAVTDVISPKHEQIVGVARAACRVIVRQLPALQPRSLAADELIHRFRPPSGGGAVTTPTDPAIALSVSGRRAPQGANRHVGRGILRRTRPRSRALA